MARKTYLSFGTVFFLLILLSVTQQIWPTRVIREEILPRQGAQTLFIAFDGVPFDLVEELFQQGKLEGYQKPSRLISAFPSTTTACFTGIFRPLGAEKGPGYDAKFFSYEDQEVKGNLLEAYDVGGSGYKKFFSYMRSSGFEQVVMYTAPLFAARVDLARLKPALWKNPAREKLFFYIGSSDGAAHLDGKEAVVKLFLEAVQKVKAIREEYAKDFGQELKVVLFSDHGFYWDQMKPVDLADFGERLKKAGLNLEENLKRENNVSAISWGNISGGDLYMLPEIVPEVTSVLMEIPGIDLVLFREENKIVVQGKRERVVEAEILYDEEGTKFAYRTVDGDPLKLISVFAALAQEGNLDREGFVVEKDLFEATKTHMYPDPLYRIWDAFFGLAQNPATVLISTKENYEFGGNGTRFGAKIRGGLLGTHGALALHSSSAFVMASDPSIIFPEVVRYDQAFAF